MRTASPASPPTARPGASFTGTPRTVAVVGGGVIGVMTAYELARRGVSVTIVERGRIGGGASHGNCGLVSPSHILPLTMPGMVRQGLAYLLARNAPLAVRPRLDPALWGWLLRFAGNCNAAAMHEAGHARLAMLVDSMTLYRELIDRESLDVDWEHRGTVNVYRSRHHFEAFAPLNDELERRYGLAATPLTGDELAAREPAVRDDLAGGWFFPQDAHLRPDRLMSQMRNVLLRLGVTILEETPVRELLVEQGRLTAVVCAGRDVTADRFVVAAGAHTPTWQRALGCRLPVQPGKGYSLTMTRPVICPTMPLLFHEDRVVATPWASGYRLGSLMEFTGFDETVRAERVRLLIEGANRYFREPVDEDAAAAGAPWVGFRPMSADERPIIDLAPAAGNTVIATGHGMLGLSMATATGRMVAEMLVDQPHTLDPTPYRLERFARRSRKRRPGRDYASR